MPRSPADTWQAEIRAELANLEQVALATKPSSGDLPSLRQSQQRAGRQAGLRTKERGLRPRAFLSESRRGRRRTQ